MNPTPLVTIQQAAYRARVSPTELRRWIAAGHVQPVACAVHRRALLLPLAAVLRAERSHRYRKALRHAEQSRLLAS